MTTQDHGISLEDKTRKAALNRRLEDYGWGVLLITIGTIWLLPEGLVPKGSWLIAAGLILLGLNAIRCFNAIAMNSFSLVVGTLALLAGLGEYFGLKMPLFAIALIVIGACILLKPVLEKSPTSGTSPGWWCGGHGEQAGHRDSPC